jgi:hypothetical protein
LTGVVRGCLVNSSPFFSSAIPQQPSFRNCAAGLRGTFEFSRASRCRYSLLRCKRLLFGAPVGSLPFRRGSSPRPPAGRGGLRATRQFDGRSNRGSAKSRLKSSASGLFLAGGGKRTDCSVAQEAPRMNNYVVPTGLSGVKSRLPNQPCGGFRLKYW